MERERIKLRLMEIFGVLLGLLFLSPFYIILVNSFKTKKEFLLTTLSPTK